MLNDQRRFAANASSSRRMFVLGSAAAITASALPGLALASGAQQLTFRVWRKGSDIGRHEINFDPTATGTRVTVNIDVAVSIAFVTAYRYNQQAEDLWRDGVLVKSRVKTNDDGTASALKLDQTAGSIMVDGPNGQFKVPEGTMTDLSFWNQNIVNQTQLLNTTMGKIKPVQGRFIADEVIEQAGRQINAKRFFMASEGGRSGDIWFDENGNWTAAEFVTSGETLIYERI